MRFPRVTVGTLMATVILAAMPCVVYRSFAGRPDYLTDSIRWAVLATLPMLNLLAIIASVAIRRRFRVGPFLIGFSVFGILAVIATLCGLEPVLNKIEMGLERSQFVDWVEASALRMEVFYYLFFCVLPQLTQLMIAAVGGIVTRAFWTRSKSLRQTEPGEKPLRAASVLALLVLISIQVLVIEGALRWKVDPLIPKRFEAGALAAYDTDWASRIWNTQPANTRKPITGTKVRIVSDNQPDSPESVQIGTAGKIVLERDVRAVRVLWLDGEDAGKEEWIPYWLLTPSSGVPSGRLIKQL